MESFCPDTDFAVYQYPITSKEGKVESFCQETDFPIYQYPITNKEGKVESFCPETDFTIHQYPIANKEGKVEWTNCPESSIVLIRWTGLKWIVWKAGASLPLRGYRSVALHEHNHPRAVGPEQNLSLHLYL